MECAMPLLEKSAVPNNTGTQVTALSKSVEEHISGLFSSIQHMWRSATEDDVRESLLGFALMISSSSQEDAQALIRKHVQKGLFLILQRHYASYKKHGDKVYTGFMKKFDILLDLMPLTFQSKPSDETVLTAFVEYNDDEGIEVLIHLFQTTLDRHSNLFVSVLQGLRRLSLSDQAKTNVLHMTLVRMPKIEMMHLPLVLELVGEFPADDMESIQTVSSVRNLWLQLEKHDSPRDVLLSCAENIVHWFGREWNGHFLATAYLHSIDESTDSIYSDHGIPILDMIVLLSLSADVDFGEQATQIMDSWVDLSGYFTSLYRTIFLLKLDGVPDYEGDAKFWHFSHEFVSPLINLAIRLLSCNDSKDSDRVHDFCLKLFHHFLLDSDRPVFVDLVVHLWNRIYKEEEADNPGAIHHVMESLSRHAPEMMRWNRDLFIHALESSAIKARLVSSSISATLVSLFVEEEQEELLSLVNRLLFGPVDSGFDSRTTNGVILATEIIRTRNCGAAMLEKLKARVLTVLLPANRRTVLPDLGSPGLAFLELCGLKSSSVFPDIQMILANTGLIQRLSTYKESTRKYLPILGYSSKQNTSKDKPTFIFCAAFFLRHLDCADFRQWDSTVRWVFDLVDVYLANGRKKSKTLWNPRGWLQAVVEFPGLDFPFYSRGSQQTKAAKWFLEDFGSFDVSLLGSSPPPATFRAIIIDLFLRQPDVIARLHSSLLQFSLGLFVGLGLSAAVLKNAFVYYKQIKDAEKKPPMLRMIENQIMKIYHLKDKLNSLETVLAAVEGALKRMENDTKMGEETKPFMKVVPASGEIVLLRETINSLSETMFCTPAFIDDAIMWECLTDSQSTNILRDHVRLTLCMDFSSEIAASKDEVVKTMESKLRVASQLVCTGGASVSDLHGHLMQLASLSFFVVPLLPKLRGALTDMDRPPLSSWVRYAATTTQLLTLCFRQQMERTNSVEDLVKTLSPTVPVSDQSRRSDDVFKVVEGLKQHLTVTDDVHVAGSLLDILAILGCTKSAVLDIVLKASNEVIRKAFAKSSLPTSIATLPYSVSVLTQSLKAPAKAMATIRKALDTTVCRRSAGPGRPTDGSYWVYRYPLLHQFGLLVQDRSSSLQVEAFQNELSIEMESVLDWTETRSQLKLVKEADTPSPFKRSKKYASSIQGLTATTVADFFETSLHMSVGIIAIYPPAFVTSQQTTALSPYRRLEAVFRSFHRLTHMYAKYYRHFPRRTASAMYGSIRSMFDLIEVQINRCADWRSSCPLPKPDATYDPGSLVFLGQLVQSCRELIVDCVDKVIQIWNEDKVPQITSKGQALQQGMGRFCQTLDEICSAHGLSAEDDRVDGGEKNAQHKRRRVAVPPVLYHNRQTEKKETDDMDGDFVQDSGMEDNDVEDESFVQWGQVRRNQGTDEDSLSSMEEITIQRVS